MFEHGDRVAIIGENDERVARGVVSHSTGEYVWVWIDGRDGSAEMIFADYVKRDRRER